MGAVADKDAEKKALQRFNADKEEIKKQTSAPKDEWIKVAKEAAKKIDFNGNPDLDVTKDGGAVPKGKYYRVQVKPANLKEFERQGNAPDKGKKKAYTAKAIAGGGAKTLLIQKSADGKKFTIYKDRDADDWKGANSPLPNPDNFE